MNANIANGREPRIDDTGYGSVNELLDIAAPVMSTPQRIARILFIPRDLEASVKRHERYGSKILRDKFMHYFGDRISKPVSSHPYRISRSVDTDRSASTEQSNGGNKKVIDVAADFALRQTVYNEVIHIIPFLGHPLRLAIKKSVAKSRGDRLRISPLEKIGIFANLLENLGLIAIQRYNRSRMLRMIDRKIKRGQRLTELPKDYFGVNSVISAKK